MSTPTTLAEFASQEMYLNLARNEFASHEMYLNHRGEIDQPVGRFGRSLFLDHQPEILAAPRHGLGWTNGPTILDNGRLIFSDSVRDCLWSWSEDSLQRLKQHAGGCPGREPQLRISQDEELLRANNPSTYCFEGQQQPGPSSLAIDPRTGLLISCQLGARRVARLDPETLDVVDLLAVSFDGQPLNSPTDVAVSFADGSIVFTDSYAGLLETIALPYGDNDQHSSAKSSLGFAGVYMVPPPRLIGGADPARPRLLADDIARPNGVGFELDSPEGGRHTSAGTRAGSINPLADLCPCSRLRLLLSVVPSLFPSPSVLFPVDSPLSMPSALDCGVLPGQRAFMPERHCTLASICEEWC